MQHFNRDEFEVHVACNPTADGSGESQALAAFRSLDGIHVIPARLGFSVAQKSFTEIISNTLPAMSDLLWLLLYIRRGKIDIIHVASRPRDVLLGILLGKLTGARTVIHLHIMFSNWFGRVMRWALRECTAILCISDFVAQSVCAAGYAPDKVFRVLNGIDAHQWDPTLGGTAIRKEFGIGPDVPVLVIIARLFYWKGHTELLKALAIVQKHVPDFRLLVVGRDDPAAHPGGGSYTADLQSLASDLCLQDKVIFTGQRQDISRILAACDVFTMPSFEEPLGLVFLEAMAMQKPVIALNSGGVPEVVEHGKSGLLSEPNDIKGLADNILALLRDPQLRRSMGLYGRSYVEKRLDPLKLAQETERLYRRVIFNDKH